MRSLALAFVACCLAAPALAGNTSSNSSSNSSNGVHTRVDTVIQEDDRGRRRVYERRIHRDEREWRRPRRYWRD
jgi:hypothetical protein